MPEKLRDFAERYTAAWCRHDAAGVAGCYQPDGSLRINNNLPAVGREAIGAAAQSFMTAFPDLQVTLDDVVPQAGGAIYRWTLLGTHTGPDGSGKRVRISGFEVWQLAADDSIAVSQGHFDELEYLRQIEQAPPAQA